ncbi:MAG: hypothetical protein KDD55_02140, partial [Bdellovibrionales bacterium]|nr:hypothetical protein [Bdellovibrionales bacterium]
KSLFTIDNTSLFGEAGSVWIASEDRALWGQPDLYNLYWTNQIDDSGSRTAQDPYGYIDGGRLPSGSYQFCCNSATWRSAAVAVNLMPELRAVWNNESFMEYEKRWVSFGAWTQPDPCAPVEGTCTGGSNAGAKCTSASETSSTPRCGTGTCTMNSDLLGVTYGDDGTGDCIADADSSDGVGRFPALHGASSNDGDWTSTFAAQMLDAYPLE